MKKGFTAWYVIMFLILFISLPLLLWHAIFKENAVTRPIVKGASSVNSSRNGVEINVVSLMGSFDLYQFVCPSKEECEKELLGGKKYAVVSGGKSDEAGKSIFVENSDLLDEFEYMKIFVRSGWGSASTPYSIKSIQSVEGAYITDISDSGSKYSAVVFPLKTLSEGRSGPINFSDD
jgi:hypothetical protein